MLAIANDVDLLKSLSTTLIDSVHGYREAAEHADEGLREMFLLAAAERHLAVERLQQRIRELGGEPDNAPSLMGQVHQRWLAIRSAIEGGDENAILDEVESGESYLQQKFQESVDDESVQGEARRAIEEAYESVCARFDQVQSIRRARDAAMARQTP